MNAELSHAQVLFQAFFDDGDVAHSQDVSGIAPAHLFHDELVDLIDDGQMAGKQLFKQRYAPAFQGFWQNGVVCIRKYLFTDLPSFVEAHAFFIDKDAHQLRNCQSGMSVVQLNADFVGKSGKTVVILLPLIKDVLQGCRYEEVFLLQPQDLAQMYVIVRIQYFADVFADVFLFYCFHVVATIEVFKIKLIGCIGFPQAKVVDIVHLVTGDGDVPSYCHHVFCIHPGIDASLSIVLCLFHFSAKAYSIRDLRALYLPGTAVFAPVIRYLSLKTFAYLLTEDAKFVADTITIARIGGGGQ